jgi:outer membrane biosynthesis protein TonB
MADALTLPPLESPRSGAVAEALSVVLGAGFTLVLFLAVAHFGVEGEPAEEPEMSDLRAMSIPMESPPPRPVEVQPVTAVTTPFSGLDVAAAESPVKIVVVPPDLATLLPANTTAPAARINPAQLYTEFKPSTEIGGDFSRIFQQYEVDKRPEIVAQPKPTVPGAVRGGAKVLRLNVMFVVDTNGRATNLRLLETSGNKYFDEIMLRLISESWLFTPGMKKGHKVRVLVQRSIRIEWTANTPFDP